MLLKTVTAITQIFDYPHLKKIGLCDAKCGIFKEDQLPEVIIGNCFKQAGAINTCTKKKGLNKFGPLMVCSQ